MKCRNCGNLETIVIDSRIIEKWKTIRRRRECESCKNRFTTFERRWTKDLFVIKKDETRQTYDRTKIREALMLAFAKRNTSAEKIDNIISDLETKWFSTGKEITSIKIWNDMLNYLKNIDLVAYIRFASVYKNFENISDFKEIISPLEEIN